MSDWGQSDLEVIAKQAARIAALESQNAALLNDVNQDEGYERLKAKCEKLEAALKECEQVRDSWCKAFTEQRDDAEALVRRCAALETEAQPEVPIDLQSNCPYAFPHRYCQVCPVQPCPAGLPQRPTSKIEGK